MFVSTGMFTQVGNCSNFLAMKLEKWLFSVLYGSIVSPFIFATPLSICCFVSYLGDVDVDGPLEVVKPKKMPICSETTEVPPLTIDGELHYPFQIQIEYTAHNGSRLMKVITNAKPLTRDRNIAEKGLS